MALNTKVLPKRRLFCNKSLKSSDFLSKIPNYVFATVTFAATTIIEEHTGIFQRGVITGGIGTGNGTILNLSAC